MSSYTETLAKLFAKLEVIQDSGLDLESKSHLQEARKICHELLNLNVVNSPISQAENKIGSSENSSNNISLMVVDDDEDTQRMLRFALKKKGFDVVSFTNPVEALSKVGGVNPTIILLDLMMPEMTGFEFLQRMASHPSRKTLRIAVGSSRTYDKDRVAVLEAGANDFIPKPYNLAELVVRLRNLAR